MRRVFAITAACALALSATLVGSGASADTSKTSYSWHIADDLLEEAVGSPPWAIAEADNGDEVWLDGTGMLDGATKAANGGGRFIHFAADGSLVARGTFTAHELISFHFYGCEDVGIQVCGGLAKLAVTLTPEGTSLQIPATLWVDCLIGQKIPPSAEEGVRLNVNELINFDHTVLSGFTIYIPS